MSYHFPRGMSGNELGSCPVGQVAKVMPDGFTVCVPLGTSPGTGEPICGPGEEFDTTSMQCVTAGQAYTPIPDVPQAPPAPASGSAATSPYTGGSAAAPTTVSRASTILPAVAVGAAVGAAILAAAVLLSPKRST